MKPRTYDIQVDWNRGMVRDAPRTAVPESSLYDSRDFLLDQPGIMRKRGGTTYAGPALDGAYAHTVQHVADSGNVQYLAAIDNLGDFYEVTPGSTTNIDSLGATYLPLQKPAFFQDKLILTSNDGFALPKYYDGSSVSDFPVTAPTCRYAEVFKGRLVLANTGLGGDPGNYPFRLWFSPPIDITDDWDVDAWIDCDYAITGLAANASMLLIFSRGHTEKIVGTIPPGSGTTGSDMNKTQVGAVGCTDARSIGHYGNNVIFANTQGVYTTNGIGFECLTDDGQIGTYWKSLFDGYVRTSWSIAGEVYGDNYIVTILNGSTKVDTLMLDIPRQSWWRLTNIPAGAYAVSKNVYPELYFADFTAPRVGKMSGIYLPTSANTADADGTPVTPQAELRITGQGPDVKHFGFGHITYDLRDSGGTNPNLALSVAPGIEAPTYADVPQSPLLETTDATRKRYVLAKRSQAVNLKLTQANASAKTEIYGIEAGVRSFGYQAGGQ